MHDRRDRVEEGERRLVGEGRRTASASAGEVRGPVATITESQAAGGSPATSARSIVTSGCASSRAVTSAEKGSRSMASALPAGTAWRSAVAMISPPAARISQCRSPTAFCSSSSERKEFEQTSSASPPVLWAKVPTTGRISCSTTRHARLGDLPGGLGAGHAAADDVNGSALHPCAPLRRFGGPRKPGYCAAAGIASPRCTAGRARKASSARADRREFLEPDQLARLVEADEVADPREGGDVGDGVVRAGDPRLPGEHALEHGEQPPGLADVAVARPLVLEIPPGELVEEADLPEHRPDPAHLEHQPLQHAVAPGGVAGDEPAGLLGEIDEDRPRLEEPERRAAGAVRVDDRRDLAVRVQRQKGGTPLVAAVETDAVRLVGQPGLLEQDRDLHPVRCRHRVELQPLRVPGRPLGRHRKAGGKSARAGRRSRQARPWRASSESRPAPRPARTRRPPAMREVLAEVEHLPHRLRRGRSPPGRGRSGRAWPATTVNAASASAAQRVCQPTRMASPPRSSTARAGIASHPGSPPEAV